MKTNRKILRSFWLLVLPLAIAGLFSCGGQQAEKNQAVAAATREIGEAYMRQGDYTAALRELLKAEQLDPEDPFVHNDLGLCYMNKKRMPDAIAHFKKAALLKPSYAPARNNLGAAYMEVEQWDAAIDVFKEITKDVLYATPQFPLANLGWCYYHKGDYRSALKYFKEALKLQEDFIVALRGTGQTYMAVNQGNLALRYLERAVQLAPKVADIHFELAEAYLLVGRFDQARASYETVIDLASPESTLAQKARQRLGAIR